jgi:hypothetical protein
MSSIAITGGATGTGVFSLVAPSTSTNRTINLPDSNGTVATAESTLTQFNASGSAPVYACRAWVNFNGTGTVAIRASGNVSSITDNGTGDYTVNFTSAMPDANYGFVGTSSHAAGSTTMVVESDTTVPTTSAVRLYVMNAGGSAQDRLYVNASIFR